jgi:hypothetical protein
MWSILLPKEEGCHLLNAPLYRILGILPRLFLKAIVKLLDEPVKVTLHPLEVFLLQWKNRL